MKNLLKNQIINYPTPLNFSYFFGFGFLAGILLISQIISGLILAMYYSNNINLAFESIEFFVRNVNYGWFIRYLHSNGASFLFIVLYIHILKALIYKSYLFPRHLVWFSGLIMFILLMATAFLGYVLPWGQMSFWGATVITSLFSVIPIVGDSLIIWLWGGFSIENPTLMRFFVFHFILPFFVLSLIFLHLMLLHKVGSSNPILVEKENENIKFFPYFFFKDFFLFLILCFLLIGVICYYPNLFNHSDNYIKANSLVTPSHIVPEWYFLPFYAILRSIENKSLGIFFMFFSIVILFLLPLISFKTFSFNFSFTNLIYKINYYYFDNNLNMIQIQNNNNLFYKASDVDYLTRHYLQTISFLVVVFCLLGWIGQVAVSPMSLLLGQILTFLYFSSFFVIFFPSLRLLVLHIAIFIIFFLIFKIGLIYLDQFVNEILDQLLFDIV